MTSSHFSFDEKQQTTSVRLFPTPSAKERDYPFKKQSNQFTEEKKINMDGASHHVASIMQKKRDLKQNWYVIYNFAVPENNYQRRNAFIVTAGEIYALAFGGPKYRIKESGKQNEPYISKGIKGFVDFVDYIHDVKPIMTIEKKDEKFSEKHFLEGMGRVILNKYLYKEDDFTFGNMGVDENGMFVAIDPGQTFAPLPSQLEEKTYNKYTSYYPSLLGHQSVREENFGGQSWYYQKSLQHVYTGIHPHVLDYDELPTISFFLPRNWEFNDQLPHYAKQLAQNKLFLNEKHFAAIKELVTKGIKNELIQIHMWHDEDSQALQKQVNATLADFIRELAQSNTFLSYLNKYRLSAVKAILYEIREFIIKNSHYQYRGDAKADESQWNQICHLVLDEFSHLLKSLDLKELSRGEVNELKDFAKGIQKNQSKELRFVKSFYEEQGATIRASKVKPLILKPKKIVNCQRVDAEKATLLQASPSVFFFSTQSLTQEYKDSREEATRLTQLALEKEAQLRKSLF